MMAVQSLRYENMTVFIFEAGLSAYPLTRAVGGRHFNVAADERPQLAPLQFLDTRIDRAWAMDWIDKVLLLNDFKTTPEQRTAIATAILSMHENGGKTLSDFFNACQDEEVREALMQYTVNGAMGHLLDAADDALGFSRFNTFELGELMELGDKYAVPALLYLFRRVVRSLKGQPAVIYLDEAWLMLLHPVFEQWIRKWLKTLAKLNCAVLLSTQNLTDAAKSSIFDVIVDSTATKIFLPNPDALSDEMAALYRRMGLNERQIHIVANALPKQQYYLVSEAGRRLYELGLGPLAQAFVGATDPVSLATVRRLEAQHGDAWVHEWLAMRGLKLRDYLEAA
jgi:type IV secretion system protein VirB4